MTAKSFTCLEDMQLLLWGVASYSHLFIIFVTIVVEEGGEIEISWKIWFLL